MSDFVSKNMISNPAFVRLVKVRAGLTVRWKSIALPLGLFLVVLLPRILDLSAFITADEDDQIMFAHLFLKSALQGDWAGALVLGYPGVPTLILGGLGVALRYLAHYQGWLPLPWATDDLMTTIGQVTTRFGVFEYPLDFLLWVRLPMALTAALSVLGIYWLLKHMLDSRIALLGTLIIAFDPFILAHSRVIHVDAPLAHFMFISFLAFLLYLEQGRWKWLILSGLFGALAGLSKTPAAVLGPILVVSGIIFALFPPPGMARSVRWKRLIVALLGWGLVAAAAFFALWPSMWTRPGFALQWIVDNISSVNSQAHPTTGVFWGSQQTDQNPFYYLIVLPYHLTVLTSVGVTAGVGMIIAGLTARWRKKDNWLTRHLPLALALATYVIIFIAPVSIISRRGDRYILPVFFAVGLLSALSLWAVADWVSAAKFKSPKNTKITRFLTPCRLVGAAILLQVAIILLFHPYYLAYYNPLMGSYRTIPYRINIGWGEGLDRAADYLNRVTGPDKPQVAAWYSAQFAPYYHGPTVDLSNQSAALTGDYTVFYINQIQRGFPSKEILTYFWQREPVEVIKLGGIDYAWIFDGPVVSRTLTDEFLFSVNRIFGGGARLVGVNVPQQTFPVDAYTLLAQERAAIFTTPYTELTDGLPVTLYWETLAQINGEHNIYIRLVDEAGTVWGQVDRMILAGLWRPDRWRSGYFLRDEYKLPIDAATPPGTYQLEVGMYDFVTGQSYGVARNIGQIILTPPGAIPVSDNVNIETRLTEPINDTLTLLGHNFSEAQLPAGAEISGKIFWQSTGKTDKDYQIEFAFQSDQNKYVLKKKPLSPSYPPAQWQKGEIVGAAYQFRIPAEAPAGEYPVIATVVEAETGQYIGPAVMLATVSVEPHERNFDLPQNVTPISAFLNGQIELVGYKLHNQTVAPRDSFGLTLYWRSLRAADTSYTAFVHAIGPDASMRGQWDSVPVQGNAPTTGWLPGEIIEDHYEIPMSKDAPAWKYDIFVGMYDPLTGERLPTTSQNAPTSDNRIWLTRVQVVDPE
jgi:hypothetical protein